jgi:hypothetical protein
MNNPLSGRKLLEYPDALGARIPHLRVDPISTGMYCIAGEILFAGSRHYYCKLFAGAACAKKARQILAAMIETKCMPRDDEQPV